MHFASNPQLTSVPFRVLLDRHRHERPHHVAIIDGATGQSITYGDLHARVGRIAASLATHGVRRGDRVACLALNSKAYTEFLLALAWLGAVSVPLNVRLAAPELRYILEDSGATACFACTHMAELAEASLRGMDAVTLRVLQGAARDGWMPFERLASDAQATLAADPTVHGETLCMLLYTSGTTGKPKGCMIPQRTWAGYAVNMATCFQMGPRDVYLAFLPYFHVAGVGTAFAQLFLGGTIVTAQRAEPKTFYSLIEQHRISIVFLVPGISAAFVHDEARTRTDLSSLRLFISGAGVEKPELIEAVERELGAAYFGIYGQTESGGKVTFADAAMLRADPTTYGHVMPFFDYMLADENDRDVGVGAAGELCVRGGTVMQGYWNQPEATAATLRNGWHHTGDVFQRLPNGQVRMVDRKKYLIKTGGENVYPQEVEQVLLQHAAIADAAVIGVRDDQWGEVVTAFVVTRPGETLDARTVADWVGRHIAGYKKPRRVHFVTSLPRNVSGKVLKNELQDLAAQLCTA